MEGTLPPFAGGWAGHVSYDAVRVFEPRVPLARGDELGFADVCLYDFDEVVAFDNARRVIQLIVEVRGVRGQSPRQLYSDAQRRIAALARKLSEPLRDAPRPALPLPKMTPRFPRRDFLSAVRKAKAAITAGDCQQIVLSQRFDAQTEVAPLDLYRALRRVNPSPYQFIVREAERTLVGGSPETLVSLSTGELRLRPIAGTRPRGATAADDAALEQQLRADPKENAEHVMLVDLGRNDLGRVATIGSVRVADFKSIERYSHVMHLVSEIRARLAPGLDAIDVLRATFPAGTVSGAPKVRAMQLIDRFEPTRRGPYAGCVGYFDRGGSMETCITIRTLYCQPGSVSIQAGAGVVYDSVPAREYDETVNKAAAMFKAVELACTGRVQVAARGTKR